MVSAATGSANAGACVSLHISTLRTRHGKLTKAVHNIKKDNEQYSCSVHPDTRSSHMERSLRHILSPRKYVRRNSDSVRSRRKYNKGARQHGESGSTAQWNSSQTQRQKRTKQRCRDGTAEVFVDAGEELREGCGFVAGERPPDAAAGEKCANKADEKREEDDGEKAEGASFCAGCLVVDCREWEGAVAVDDGVKVGDGVEEGDAEKEGTYMC